MHLASRKLRHERTRQHHVLPREPHLSRRSVPVHRVPGHVVVEGGGISLVLHVGQDALGVVKEMVLLKEMEMRLMRCLGLPICWVMTCYNVDVGGLSGGLHDT